MDVFAIVMLVVGSGMIGIAVGYEVHDGLDP